MNTGMLVTINLRKKETLEQQIQSALDLYKRNYGIAPNLCHYNPGLSDKMAAVHFPNVMFVASQLVSRNQLHFGIKETPLG